MRDIILIADPALVAPTSRVSRKLGGQTSRRLWKVLRDFNKKAIRTRGGVTGIGLAAPQIGESLRVCVVALGGEQVALINPTLEYLSPARWPNEEGCLSFPRQTFTCWRCPRVRVHADNLPSPLEVGSGGPSVDRDGFHRAVVFQHEISHCFGLIPQDFHSPDHPQPAEWEEWSESLRQTAFPARAFPPILA